MLAAVADHDLAPFGVMEEVAAPPMIWRGGGADPQVPQELPGLAVVIERPQLHRIARLLVRADSDSVAEYSHGVNSFLASASPPRSGAAIKSRAGEVAW